MDSRAGDQQPIARTVGRRKPAPAGEPPGPEARAAWNALANYRTRAPKGVFIYASHQQMIDDRERWAAEAVIERAR